MTDYRKDKFAVYFYVRIFSNTPVMRVGRCSAYMVTEWSRRDDGSIRKSRAVYADKYLAFFDTLEEAEAARLRAEAVCIAHDDILKHTYDAWLFAKDNALDAVKSVLEVTP